MESSSANKCRSFLTIAYVVHVISCLSALPSQRKRKSLEKRPPLVDSNLLRFLSSQQREYRVAVDELLSGGGGPISVDPVSGLPPLESTLDSAATDVRYTPEGESRETSPTPGADEATWIRQYERSNVAVLLQSAGLETVLEAGIHVETMAVARASRRRVRSFLKERDQVWSTTSNQQYELSYETAADTISNHNNLEQVIDLLLPYGLSAKDIAEILILTPGIAFMQPRPVQGVETNGATLQETVESVFEGLLMGRSQPHELGLRKYDARKVLRNTPGLLSMRGSKSATEMVVLLTRLGVSSSSLSRDKNALPTLLSRKPAAVFRLVSFLSSDAVRMPMEKIGPLLRRAECQDLLNAVAPVPRPGQQQRHRKISSSEDAVAAQVRRVVVNDIYRRMSQTAWTLRNEIGTKDLGMVIAAYPSVLLLDASRQILPTAQYLMNDLGIFQDDLPRVLQLYPSLLRMDVEQMRNVVSYLTSLEVAEDNLGNIFRSFPALLTLDIEHDMEPVVAFLRSIGISNVGRFISRLPPVLGYSVDKELRPKFEYLASVLTDARFEVSKFPAFFSYPLERVIKTRFEYLRDIKRIPTPLLSLDHVLCSGDKDFATKVARDPDGIGYARFAEKRKKALGSGGRTANITPTQRTTSQRNQVPRNVVARLDAAPPHFPPSASAVTG